MNHHRIAVIGLGQRIAHVLVAMKEVGWMLEVAGYADAAPVGLPILADAGIDPGRAFEDQAAQKGILKYFWLKNLTTHLPSSLAKTNACFPLPK